MRRVAPRGVGIALVVALLAGCRGPGGGDGQASESGPPPVAGATETPTTDDAEGGSLRVALAADPASIDPRFASDPEGRIVVDAVFDSLVRLDHRLQPRPAAAVRWEVNEDATTFTFELDPEGRFHDGTPVTAADFVRAFDRIASGTAEPRSFLSHRLEAIVGYEDAQASGAQLAGLEVLDPLTLEIDLRYPFAEFPEVLADPTLGPVPPAADLDVSGFGERPVGNGPFQLAEPWQHDQFIRLARAAPTDAGGPLLDEVVFQIYAHDTGGEAQYADLQEGQLHVAEVPVARLEQAVEEFGLSDDGATGPGVLDGVTSAVYYYGFNTSAPPFDDPDVRRAVAALVDRERIVETVTRSSRRPATAIVPPTIPGAQEGACGATCTYDPERAAELLADRALEPVRITHNQGRTHTAIAAAVARELEAVGLEVELVALDLAPFVQTVRAGDVEIFRLGWEADYPSPGAYLHPLFSSDRVGTDNLTRFSDPEVDELLTAARAEQDESARVERYREVERRLLDLAVVAPILFYEHNRVVAPEVRGLAFTPLGAVDLTRAWLEPTP